MAADRVLSGPGAEGGASQSQGRLIGRRYRLMSPVGRGGMGMVWHAHDVLLARDVAVKELILPFGLDHAGKQVAHRRMLREARSAARLTHPGIVTVHDVVEEDGRPWIVMELVRAWSLEQAVRQSGPLPVIQATEIGIRVLDALRHAHSAGILHRDIKPGNVLLTSDRVVLTDFGIAAIEGDVTITQTGLLMGSPAYIPPERLSGQPLTQAADLWSFGATLYAAVEGRPPYEGPDAIAVLGTVLTQEPNPPQRAGALRPVIDGLLRKNPAERLTSDQVVEQLEQVLRANGSARPRVPDVPPPPPLPPDPGSGPAGPPPGPLPSRIVETPSGPVRVPYDPLSSSSGGYAVASPSGAHQTDRLRQPPGPDGFDAFGSRSGPHRVPDASAPHRLPDTPSGPHRMPDASGPHRMPDASGPHRMPDASGPHRMPDASGPHRMPDAPSGPHRMPDPPQEAPFVARGLLDSPSNPPLGGFPSMDDDEPSAPPILPLTSDSRTAGGSAPWPLASADDLRDQSRDLSHEVPHSRLATLPGVAHRQTRSRRRPEESGNAWVRRGRPTPLLILTAVGSVVAVVAALVFFASGGTPGPVTATASPAASAEAEADASPVPEGFKEHTPPGFTVALPPSWKLSASGDRATFSGPEDSGMTIVVEQATPQADGGLSELGRREADGGVDAYIQVQLQAVKYRGWKAADWEYTYTTENGVPMHALTRHVTIDDRTAFTISFELPELRWDDEADTRKVFLDTFRQTT
ncbi:serine/threonine protein kinase [Nonomuraea sp. SBT364]|uniref:serine/threonine protein kinase n=1 Tax=Nonomuraea sp. SBT364 TaxID=1580530 RepID=UPI000A8E4420|nr:serine/threonine-protein kinase [Nonomuraea sp. SBT364]